MASTSFKVIACMPVKGRIPLIKHTISRLVKANKCFKVICTADTKEEQRAIIDSGGEFVYHDNAYLGQKWNAAFKRASVYNPDACLFVGSSDWITDNWIDVMLPYLSTHDMVGKPDFNMLHINHNGRLNMARWGGYGPQSPRNGEPIGIGRMISAPMLKKINYEPFRNDLNSSLDYSMFQKIQAVGGRIKTATDETTQSLSLSCDLWPNKHIFLRESIYYTSSVIKNEKQWLQKWGFFEAFDFAREISGVNLK